MEKVTVMDEDSEQMHDVRKMVSAQNRKKKKSGGFQSMGRNFHVNLTAWSLLFSIHWCFGIIE